MLKDELLQLLQNIKKGSFIHLEYKSFPKPAKGHKGETIEKVTNGTYRLGITYANLKVNENKVTGPLPWGEWDTLNYIIKKGDKEYLRVYTTTHKSHTKWFVNGEEVDYDYIITNNYLTPSQQNHTHTDCFVIPIENLIQVGTAL